MVLTLTFVFDSRAVLGEPPPKTDDPKALPLCGSELADGRHYRPSLLPTEGGWTIDHAYTFDEDGLLDWLASFQLVRVGLPSARELYTTEGDGPLVFRERLDTLPDRGPNFYVGPAGAYPSDPYEPVEPPSCGMGWSWWCSSPAGAPCYLAVDCAPLLRTGRGEFVCREHSGRLACLYNHSNGSTIGGWFIELATRRLIEMPIQLLPELMRVVDEPLWDAWLTVGDSGSLCRTFIPAPTTDL